ncbi:hypothetical protein L227DRAFT_172086 [Lentinus tigrinus ALCF2SS1-6]|uniref:Uncharacterized protein n=1 Tax=Lentinus tigrinus ALCF2SS1-6 TaxID=1328759 RepID=A0A5C2S5N9_9APHY|nr:hypothetical protein L227DRAFT_172086 [Lentinus tigrinus ALCF2SS1-6]
MLWRGPGARHWQGGQGPGTYPGTSTHRRSWAIPVWSGWRTILPIPPAVPISARVHVRRHGGECDSAVGTVRSGRISIPMGNSGSCAWPRALPGGVLVFSEAEKTLNEVSAGVEDILRFDTTLVPHRLLEAWRLATMRGPLVLYDPSFESERHNANSLVAALHSCVRGLSANLFAGCRAVHLHSHPATAA